MTTPRPRAVVIGSLSLFAVLFVLLTIELSTGSSSASAQHRKAKPAIVETHAGAEPEAAEPEYIEPETEYVEPEPEYEYVEPEVEEVPPVVTSSS
jgi:hypothetical protein